MEIFDRVFSETETEPVNSDSIDGIVEDILVAIAKKVRSLIRQKFVSEVLLNNNGQDESSSKEEACWITGELLPLRKWHVVQELVTQK